MAHPLRELGLATAILSLAASAALGQTPAGTADLLAQPDAATPIASTDPAASQAPPVDTTVPTVDTIAGAAEGTGAAAAEPYGGAASGTLSGVTGPSDADEAARLKIWMSPQMVEARAYVEQYGQRSVQFNSQAAQRYLDQLRRSSPLEMQAWLDRYAARRAGTARSEAVARAARQTAVEQTMARLQAVQQSYENLNQGQTAGAQLARERLLGQQQFAGQFGAAKQAIRDATLASQNATDYSWIVNPPLWVQERAAAASVPGDLPAGDPRNFLRGDVPVPGDPPGLGGGRIDPVFAPGATTGGPISTGVPGAGGGAGAGAAAAAGGGEGG